MFYKSETMNWSSKGKSTSGEKGAYGTHNVVEIRNGKGFKLQETIDAKGQVLTRKKHALQKKEIHHIMNGRFVPGLWTRKNRKTRKSRSRK